MPVAAVAWLHTNGVLFGAALKKQLVYLRTVTEAETNLTRPPCTSLCWGSDCGYRRRGSRGAGASRGLVFSMGDKRRAHVREILAGPARNERGVRG